MIATLYTETQPGKAAFDILATRDADITEATRDMATQTANGPGSMRLLNITRAGALLEGAQRRIDREKQERPENRAHVFVYKDNDLGTVTVTWVED
jgi:hypothetical protein